MSQPPILPVYDTRVVDIAIILPCLNEEKAIRDTVLSFRSAVPESRIFIIDNGSTDATVARALEAGAIVKHCAMRGKGHALRHAFASIDADVFLVADGDNTYDAGCGGELIRLLLDNDLDMVVGVRNHTSPDAYRVGHQLGNRMFNLLVSWTFGRQFSDIFSGYRVLSRRFVKSFPALSVGFDIETEMSVHAIQLCMPTSEVLTTYRERGAGSQSKLRTYRDGLLILWRIIMLLKYLRPFALFGAIAVAIAMLALALGMPVILDFLATGLVARFPTAVAAASLGVMAMISFVTGMILDSIAVAQRENKRLFYLAASPRVQGRPRSE